ncbi:hypothetical protein V2J09_012749 [Rumex salicifolius]
MESKTFGASFYPFLSTPSELFGLSHTPFFGGVLQILGEVLLLGRLSACMSKAPLEVATPHIKNIWTSWVECHFASADNIWLLPLLVTPTGKFCSSAAYDQFRDMGDQVPWEKAIWQGLHQPRCSFLSWIAMHERLPTKDRISRWTQLSDVSCAFSHGAVESNMHIWTSCPFSWLGSTSLAHLTLFLIAFPSSILSPTNHKFSYTPEALPSPLLCTVPDYFAIELFSKLLLSFLWT